MIDRIEEYRRDWVSGPVPTPKRARPLKVRKRWKKRYFLPLLFALGYCLQPWWPIWVGATKKYFRDEANSTKSALEIAAMSRLLRQFYLTHGRMPERPEEYLKEFLKENKPFPRGRDFWGRPYRVEHDFQGFVIRSAGANGRYGDHDDIFQAHLYRDFSTGR